MVLQGLWGCISYGTLVGCTGFSGACFGIRVLRAQYMVLIVIPSKRSAKWTYAGTS